MSKKLSKSLVVSIIFGVLIGCSTPEEKAQKYYEKGMELLESDPAKAKLEFQNALQMKKNMTSAMYGLALAAEKQSDWQACFVLLNKVIAENPQHIEATVKVGQLFLAAGELAKAKETLGKALKIDKDNLNALVLQSSIDLKEGNFKSAIEISNFVLEKDPKNTDAILVLASERYAAKDTFGTLKFLDRGLAINEKNLVMHLFKIQVLEANSDLVATEKAYQKVIGIFPNNYSIRTSLAKFYYKNNKKAEAESELRVLVEKQPDLIEPKINLVKYITVTKGETEGRIELEKMVKAEPNNFELGFQLVGLYEHQKDNKAADALLDSIIEIAGDKPEGLKAKVKVASKLLSNNQREKAVNLINEVLSIDGGQQEALLLKAGIAIEGRQYDDAIIDLRSVLRDQPNSSQALYLMAKTYEFTGSNALAEENYNKAVQSSKNSTIYGNSFAKYLMGRNEADRAEKTLEDVLKANPTNLETITLLAQVKIFKGEYDAAKALADRAGKLNDNSLSNLIQGGILAKSNDYAGSLAAFKRAHDASPSDMQPVLAIVRTYLSKKNFAEALAFLEAETVKYPNNYDLNILLGQIASASGKFDKAKASFEAAIAVNPNKPNAYQQLANLYISKGNAGAAREVVNKGLSAIKNSFDLEMLSAEIYQYNKAYIEALAVYEKLMKSHPESQLALNNYISVVADIESDKSTLESAYKLAQGLKSSNVPEFVDSLAWISYRVGKYQEAEQLTLKAIKAMPEYGIFHFHLAKIYIAKSEKLKAKASLEKALELSKNQNFGYEVEAKSLLKTV